MTPEEAYAELDDMLRLSNAFKNGLRKKTARYWEEVQRLGPKPHPGQERALREYQRDLEAGYALLEVLSVGCRDLAAEIEAAKELPTPGLGGILSGAKLWPNVAIKAPLLLKYVRASLSSWAAITARHPLDSWHKEIGEGSRTDGRKGGIAKGQRYGTDEERHARYQATAEQVYKERPDWTWTTIMEEAAKRVGVKPATFKKFAVNPTPSKRKPRKKFS